MIIHVIEPLAVSREKMDEMTATFNKAGHEVKFFDDRNEAPQVSIERSKGADIVVIGNLPYPAQVVEALPDLKMLAVAFTGVDHVAMEACKARGITVCNASGYSTVNVAELTVCFLIDLLRNVTRLDPITRRGGTRDGLVGFDLQGKTVGIVGTGVIGLQVARLLKGFQCRLIGYNGGFPAAEDLGIEIMELDKVMAQSDIVTIHCPLNDSTRGLIGANELGLMKKTAYLVNCARGPIVDTQALYDALKAKKIVGAALDVFDIEPPLNNGAVPMIDLDNVVLTPHIAFATREAFLRRADIVVNNILKWIDGTPENVM